MGLLSISSASRDAIPRSRHTPDPGIPTSRPRELLVRTTLTPDIQVWRRDPGRSSGRFRKGQRIALRGWTVQPCACVSAKRKSKTWGEARKPPLSLVDPCLPLYVRISSLLPACEAMTGQCIMVTVKGLVVCLTLAIRLLFAAPCF
jgi:hypothetical protein